MNSEQTNSFDFNTSRSIGALKNFEVTDHGLDGQTDMCKFQCVVYSNSTIRIRVTRNEAFDPFDYSVIGSPGKVEYGLTETEEAIGIETKLFHLEISKDPVRFIWKTHDGRVINQDDEGFGISWIGEQVCCFKRLQDGERFIGLGEKTGPLDRRGSGYENWNTDHYAYDLLSDPIYSSIPFYMGIHSGLAYGIFLNNSHKSHFNFGASNNRFSSFSADRGDLDYFFFHNIDLGSIIGDYSLITGKMNLPPKWSLGYQQCRYSYYPDKEVLNTAQNFRDREIPADAIVLDIHYMDKYKIFSWDKNRFPNPKAMIDQLKVLGFRVVVMCDPGIKKEEGYQPYEDGKAADIFLKYPDDTYYEGEVWPGWCHFPDFTSEKARLWWKEQLKAYSEIGIEGYWNDMNEIATWGHKLPEIIEFDFDGNRATSRKGRNVYGFMMSRSTYEAGVENLGKRPFNLTRSGFAGIQRYAAVWTGDNVATDEHMLLGIRLVNSLGLSGVSFTGFDAGGFVGNANEGLFARWISLGAFSPFFRGHSMINSRDSEPWTYGETVEEISRNYIKLRYRIMPYLYSTFHLSATTGIPVSRSLAIDYTHDDQIYKPEFENEYMFGPSILVVPVESTKMLTKAYLPEGSWYDLFTDQIFDGGAEAIVECPLDKLPLFVKASGILITQEQIYHSADKSSDILEVHLYKGSQNNTFRYYEDDGETFDYQNEVFYSREIEYRPVEKQLVFSKVEGSYESQFKRVKIYFHGFADIKLSGGEIESRKYKFVEPLTNFDPIQEDDNKEYSIEDLICLQTDLNDDEFSVRW